MNLTNLMFWGEKETGPDKPNVLQKKKRPENIYTNFIYVKYKSGQS